MFRSCISFNNFFVSFLIEAVLLNKRVNLICVNVVREFVNVNIFTCQTKFIEQNISKKKR